MILALALGLVCGTDEALDAAIARTGELRQYSFTRVIDRDGKTGSDAGTVDGPIQRLKNDAGTLYQKGKVGVFQTSAGATLKLESPPGEPDPAPHQVMIELGKGLKDVKASEASGGKTFTGALPEEVARKQALLIGEFRRASVVLRTNIASVLVKSELTIVTAVAGRELSYKSTQELSELGTARIDVPPAVAKLLGP